MLGENQAPPRLALPVWNFWLGWHLGPAGRSGAPGLRKPLDVVGESSFEAAVFKGPAEPLGVLLEGVAEPLDAILWGLAEPLEAVLGGSAEPLSVYEEHLADSHRTRASADTVLDFSEEA